MRRGVGVGINRDSEDRSMGKVFRPVPMALRTGPRLRPARGTAFPPAAEGKPPPPHLREPGGLLQPLSPLGCAWHGAAALLQPLRTAEGGRS